MGLLRVEGLGTAGPCASLSDFAVVQPLGSSIPRQPGRRGGADHLVMAPTERVAGGLGGLARAPRPARADAGVDGESLLRGGSLSLHHWNHPRGTDRRRSLEMLGASADPPDAAGRRGADGGVRRVEPLPAFGLAERRYVARTRRGSRGKKLLSALGQDAVERRVLPRRLKRSGHRGGPVCLAT